MKTVFIANNFAKLLLFIFLAALDELAPSSRQSFAVAGGFELVGGSALQGQARGADQRNRGAAVALEPQELALVQQSDDVLQVQ